MKLRVFLATSLLAGLFLGAGYSQEDPTQKDAFGRDNFKYPKGSLVGLGASLFQYKTEWSQTKKYGYPIHMHEKYEVMAFLENRSMFSGGNFHFDVRGEIRYGVYGGAEQQYLVNTDSNPPVSAPPVISESGTNFAGGAHFKVAYPLEVSPRVRLAPFLGLGLTFVLLESDGRGLDPQYDDSYYSDLSYKAGWNEFSLYSPLNVGFNLDFESFSIIPEYRFGIYGKSFTSWAPATPNPANENLPGPPIESPKQFFHGVMLNIAFRIGQ